MPRVAEAPFDSVRKMMSTVHREPSGRYVQYTKGAPDELLSKCSHMLSGDEVVPLTGELRGMILAENRKMAAKALRVLGSAMRKWMYCLRLSRRKHWKMTWFSSVWPV